MVRAPACASCQLATKCYGVRRSYAALYGTDEMHPVTAEWLAVASEIP
jgi:hypothetical protein